MQAAKDTFLMTLAARLAVINPARTVLLNGTVRTAVIAVENETPIATELLRDSFLMSWGDAGYVFPDSTLMYLDCTLRYGSAGSGAGMRADRGRVVTAMDRELLHCCEPRAAAKCDYTQAPPAALGSNIFWTLPALGVEKDSDGMLWQSATLRVFFFPEVA